MRPCRRLPLALWLGAALIAAAAPAAEPQRWQWPEVPRVVAFGDVHGAHAELLSVLRAAGVIDAEARWSGGAAHLVSVGDLLDRGPGSRAVMELLMRLEREAGAAGGQVHVVLGNHELMNLSGDRRYVSREEYAAFADEEPPGARASARAEFLAKHGGSADAAAAAAAGARFAERHPPGFFGHRAAFAADGRYGRWLLERPALVQIGETVFVHGGLPPLVADLGGAALNGRLHRQLPALLRAGEALAARGWIDAGADLFDAPEALETQLAATSAAETDAEARRLAGELIELAQSELLGSRGPFWYRGTALCHPVLERPVLEAALERLGAGRVVVGHTLTRDRRIGTRLDGRVVMIDVGMLEKRYRGRPAALEITEGRLRVIVPGLDAPEAPRVQRWQQSAPGLSREALARALAEGELRANGEPRTIGQPYLVVGPGGVEIHAIFRSRYPPELLPPGGGGDVRPDHRRRNEIAAHRLDALLDLELVPVTVERRVGDETGVLQAWAEKTIDEELRRDAGRSLGAWCAEGTTNDLIASFDALAHNRARTVYSIHYEAMGSDWRLWLTSNAFAFGREPVLPPHLQSAMFRVPPLLAERMAQLDEPTLRRALRGVVGVKEIRALLARRDALLSSRSR